jgi:hypothetical protein
MSPLVHCLVAVCLLAASAFGAQGPFRLENAYVSLGGEGGGLSELRFDAAGQGRYSPNLLRSGGFDGLFATPECAWERAGDAITVRGLELRRTGDHTVDKHPVADLLEPGHTLGQSFTVAAGQLLEVGIWTPTWWEKDSAATLRLRRDGPEGEVLVSRRLERIADNGEQVLQVPDAGAGMYYVELSEPQGKVGWWSTRDDALPNGRAFRDGQPVEGRDRSLRFRTCVPIAPASLQYTLAGPQLRMSLNVQPAAIPFDGALTLNVPWDNTGYDVSAKSVPFFRFFTSNQRYLPAEQFKRAESPGLSFAACAWMEADGTGQYDLRFSATGLTVRWEMAPDTASFHVGSRIATQTDGGRQAQVTLTALPRDDTLPAEWPAFETPDPALTADLNRLWYERAFSYPGPSGPAAWYEWSALIRYWFGGPLHDGEASALRGAPITPEGYVHTWGGSAGWPFPDNTKYDTRHFDTNARYILGCWRHLCWTHDEAFLRSQADRLRRAMEYQLGTLKGADGLIVAASKDVTGRHKGIGNNYWDIQPFGHLDAYANAVYYASLEAMAQIEEMIARSPDIKPQTAGRGAAFYRELAGRAREAYNRTFWDDGAGRYIGCVDIDGKRHDYGFTFVNLEAMHYGLASRQQAARIYEWMEKGITSSGKADTYTRWVFAPRANTIHNPMWNDAGVNDPNANGVEPWWMFGWRGTPFDDQCQDGGAILYTSFFDLMARSALVSPDNAWQRWTEILGRYREPDRLCGGPPLYRGENPQQANPGSTGTDIPFPESGLVPCWFLYGVAGVQANVDGLTIAPRLPAALPWLEIRNVQYRNLTFDVRVTNRQVTLTGRQPGQEFVWQRELPPDGEVVFSEPPAPLGAFPERAAVASTWAARWIWAPGDAEKQTRAWLRTHLKLDAAPDRAPLLCSADNGFTLYVNGHKALEGSGWETPIAADIARLLRAGDNVIAVEARNEGGPGGVLLQAAVSVGKETVTLASGPSWRVTIEEPAGWLEPGFDDSAWAPAVDLGAPPVGPWGDIGSPPGVAGR